MAAPPRAAPAIIDNATVYRVFMIALSIARRTPASESALEIMLRSREGAPSKKFRLAAATAFSCDYGHTSTNRATLCFAMRVWSRSKKETERVLDNRQSCDRHHISRQTRQLFFDGFDI